MPDFDFTSALGAAMSASNDAAPSPSPAPAEAPAPAPAAPQAPAPPAAPEAAKPAPEAPVAPETPKADETPTASDLEKLMRGEAVPEPKHGEAPTDPNSREFKRWAELRGAYDKTAKELKALQEEKSTWESKALEAETLRKELEEHRKALQEAENSNAVVKLRRDPRFQAEIEAPIQKLYSSFQEAAKEFGVNEYALAEAIKEPNDVARERRLSALFDGVDNPPSLNTIVRMSLEAKELQARLGDYNTAMENAHKTIQELEQGTLRQQEEARARQKAEYEHGAKLTMQLLERSIPSLKTPDGKINDALMNEVKSFIGRDFESLQPAQKAFHMAAPVLLQSMVQEAAKSAETIATKDKEIASLKLQLSKMSGAAPSTAPTATPAGSPRSNGEYDFSKALGAVMPSYR